jgi:two-component system sensor histidine kinase QseC
VKISIRKFLLVNLLLAITITTTLTAIGNYYLDQKDIQEHLDTLMAISTMSSQALLGDDIHKRPLKTIQQALDEIPDKIESYFKHQFLDSGTPISLINKFNFQVWSDSGKLLLHSPNTPEIPLTADGDGFSDKKIDDQFWRVFTAYNPKAGVRTVVAERYNTRNELGHRIAQDDLYIMLLTFPLSGLLIWIIIGKGLDSLDTVAKEVAGRAPHQLDPIDVADIPDEIRPLIDELNKLFNRLQAAFDREKRFAADAAHELKTPLAALKAQAQVALKTTDEHERKTALTNLISSVDRSTHTVQQLLTMSRVVPETSRINDKSKVNLIKLTREVIASLVPDAIEKQIEIEFETKKQKIELQANFTALSILIRNLVDNAIRYTPSGGEVSVAIIDEKTQVTLSVIDDGPGIPESLRARVFERFFRVLGNKSPGSGLGLAIVQQIASLHDGVVKLLTPKSGKGLQIDVVFPKRKS